MSQKKRKENFILTLLFLMYCLWMHVEATGEMQASASVGEMGRHQRFLITCTLGLNLLQYIKTHHISLRRLSETMPE